MYESFYQLTAKPFAIAPDPKFLYWTARHKMASVMLEYGFVSRAGFTVITGEVGAGKTTILQHLLKKLPAHVNVGLVSYMQGGRGELLEWVLMAFGQSFEGQSYVGLHRKFQEFLIEQYESGRRPVVVVDEAQHLGTEALEELRMLSNLNTADRQLLQIVLSGQPELKELLSGPNMTQFVQRVSSDFHLTLLDRSEVAGYIDHRLTVAGAQRKLFDLEAADLIAKASKGTPRLINILCDTAMLYGYAADALTISAEIVAKVLEDRKRHGVFQLPTASADS